jgi:hypothetical protein
MLGKASLARQANSDQSEQPEIGARRI